MKQTKSLCIVFILIDHKIPCIQLFPHLMRIATVPYNLILEISLYRLRYDVVVLTLYFGDISVAPLRQSYSIGTPLYKQNKIRFECPQYGDLGFYSQIRSRS